MGGGLSKQIITVLQKGEGEGFFQMITVLHRGVPENGYSVRQILGYYIKNIISIDLANKNRLLFYLIEIVFWGICKNDYIITWGGG